MKMNSLIYVMKRTGGRVKGWGSESRESSRGKIKRKITEENERERDKSSQKADGRKHKINEVEVKKMKR
jgi:hypothetical protein